MPFLSQVAKRLGTTWVLITSDKLRAYLEALREAFGVPESDQEEKHIGRPRKRRKVFPPGFLYGQIDKEREHGYLRCVDRRAVVGTMADIHAVLDRDCYCRVINTSIVERDNLSFRQHNGRTVRKTLSHSKDWKMHQASIDFEDAVHNFVRPHSSLKQQLPEPQGRRKWYLRTPAMVAGITNHPWSIRDIVSYRLPSRL